MRREGKRKRKARENTRDKSGLLFCVLCPSQLGLCGPSCSAATRARLDPHCTHAERASLSPHPFAHLQKHLTLGSMAQAAGSSTGFWLAGVQGSSLEEDNRHTGWALVPAETSLCGTLMKKFTPLSWDLAPQCPSSPQLPPQWPPSPGDTGSSQ